MAHKLSYLLHVPPLVTAHSALELERVVFDFSAKVAVAEAGLPHPGWVIRLGRRLRPVEDQIPLGDLGWFW